MRISDWISDVCSSDLSPDLVPPNPAEREPKSMGAYSDIMVYCGFGRLESLSTATLAWRTIFAQLRPDLIVCDHSPVICFAAYGRIPARQVGEDRTRCGKGKKVSVRIEIGGGRL